VGGGGAVYSGNDPSAEELRVGECGGKVVGVVW
jgi:hypothetical protein